MSNASRKRKKPSNANSQNRSASGAASAAGSVGGSQSLSTIERNGQPTLWSIAAVVGVLCVVGLWMYWPTLVSLVSVWNREPDYSHGYFVVPIAAYFLWSRRNTFPGFGQRLSLPGLLFLCLSGVTNVLGGLWYMEPVQAWSLPLWVAGVCWFIGGWRFLRWCLPSIAFLAFMIPLPFGVERSLTLPLQRTATQLSCWLLQTLGQPAIAEGNVIVIDDVKLSVEEACSGLRIFVSIIAVAFVFATLTRKPWWMKASLFLGVLPITLVANSVRIVATGLLQVYVSDEAAHRFGHDVAGWLMIVFAAGLMGGLIWYLGRLFTEVETVSTRELLSGESIATS
jgi:exosortase